MTTQLALDLHLKASHTFDNFITGANELVIALLNNAAQLAGEKQLFLWGEHFTGKSHLLQAACQLAADRQYTVSYLPLNQLIGFSPQLLEGLETVDLICVDDVQLIANEVEWQEKLFDLINKVRETGKQLVFAADLPPNELTLQLEDLRSRFNWGPVLKVATLNDQGIQQALQLRAQSRGFELPDNVASYMLKHFSRDMSGLFGKLEMLDQASLAEQRRLTVPFVKQVFG